MHHTVPCNYRRIGWSAIKRIPRSHRPWSALQKWLTDAGSLTARLTAKSSGQFQVEIVRQVIGRASLEECQALGIRRSDRALVREVILKGHGQPWVFARSVLPLSSLSGELRHLRKQTNRPLGAFLFNQPHLVRSPLTVAPINRTHGYIPAALLARSGTAATSYGKPDAVENAASETLWGRRSIFYLHDKPLLVSEVFLPDFVASLRPCQA